MKSFHPCTFTECNFSGTLNYLSAILHQWQLIASCIVFIFVISMMNLYHICNVLFRLRAILLPCIKFVSVAGDVPLCVSQIIRINDKTKSKVQCTDLRMAQYEYAIKNVQFLEAPKLSSLVKKNLL